MAGSGAQRALLLVLLAALACEGFAELLSCKDGVCSAPPPGPFDGAKFEMCSCVSANFNEAANFVGNSYYYKIRNFSAEYTKKKGQPPTLYMKKASKPDVEIDVSRWTHAELREYLYRTVGRE